MKNICNEDKNKEKDLIENSSMESIIEDDFDLLKEGISFFINSINDLKKKLEKSENYIKKLESDKISIKKNIKNIRIDSQKLLCNIQNCKNKQEDKLNKKIK